LGFPADQVIVYEDAPAGMKADCSAGMQTLAIAHAPDPQALEMATMIANQLGMDLLIVHSISDSRVASTKNIG
jgi:beta-phosphoglucomutase-like phosphatase (HAD superfamily)